MAMVETDGLAGWIVAAKAAELVGVSEKAIYHRVRRGKLPGLLLGGRELLVRQSDVQHSADRTPWHATSAGKRK